MESSSFEFRASDLIGRPQQEVVLAKVVDTPTSQKLQPLEIVNTRDLEEKLQRYKDKFCETKGIPSKWFKVRFLPSHVNFDYVVS